MNKEKQRGITLIALIITIIVILILVAVSVRTVVNSGLFDHAKDAVDKWGKAEKEEEKKLYTEIDGMINKYINLWKYKDSDGDKFYDSITNGTQTIPIGAYVDYDCHTGATKLNYLSPEDKNRRFRSNL